MAIGGFLRLCQHFAARRREPLGSDDSKEEVKKEKVKEVVESVEPKVGPGRVGHGDDGQAVASFGECHLSKLPEDDPALNFVREIDRAIENLPKAGTDESVDRIIVLEADNVLVNDSDSEEIIDVVSEAPVPDLGQTEHANLFLRNYFNPMEGMAFPFQKKDEEEDDHGNEVIDLASDEEAEDPPAEDDDDDESVVWLGDEVHNGGNDDNQEEDLDVFGLCALMSRLRATAAEASDSMTYRGRKHRRKCRKKNKSKSKVKKQCRKCRKCKKAAKAAKAKVRRKRKAKLSSTVEDR